ncbi:hypothetical protein [Microbacterium sp. P05]|uniref:hypothetical protein n=1 Tax=Microbacterium sp. P05 TaxID=3366948 RepID=UPI003746A33D
MARVGGRSAWIAWPVAVICAAVVGALVWLAVPGIPSAVSFVGDTLRAATTSLPAVDDADAASTAPATDCRDLYPDELWSQLVWTPKVLLSQNAALPATTTSLAQTLAPTVVFTCTWRTEDGRSISTTYAQVADGSAAAAQAALTSEGFACGLDGARVHCERGAGAVTEIHDLLGTAWLSSVMTDWMPEGYAAQTASRVFVG